MAPTLAVQLSEGLSAAGPQSVERWERLEADVSFFVEGGLVNRSLLKQLDPKKFEHWTLRSVRPRPSMRVFGRFGIPDLFVATHIVERPNLGEKWSLNWEMQKLVCEDHWRDALGESPPFRGATYQDYITENAIEDVRISL